MKSHWIIMNVLACCLLTSFGAIAQTWTKVADYGGPGRYSASGFSIGGKGYVGLGGDSFLQAKKDFWEYDPVTNVWTQKADYGGDVYWNSVGFAIGNKGYIATDISYNFWEYDPVTNTWTRRANYPGEVVGAVAFSIGHKGYIATGSYTRALWEWDGDTASATFDTWIQKSPFPPAAGRFSASGFSIGNKGYLGMGTDGNSDKRDLWEWDGDTASPTYNTWSQKSSLPALERVKAVGFSIGEQGYIGTGLNLWYSFLLNDLWKWDQASDTWIQMPDLPGVGRSVAFALSIGNLGFIGTGYGGYLNPNLKDFWKFCDTCFVSIKETFIKQEISIYPNVASDYLHVNIYDSLNRFHVMIFSCLGAKVFSQVMTGSTVLDISDLNTGFYIIKIIINDMIYSTKLIIER